MTLVDGAEHTRSSYIMTNMLQRLRKNWFLVGVVCVITCAKLWPWIGAKGGKRSDRMTFAGIAAVINRTT